jgi:hypothetical protein
MNDEILSYNKECDLEVKLTIKKSFMPVVDWMEDTIHRIVHFGEFINKLKPELEENDVTIRDIIYPKEDERNCGPFIIFDINEDYCIKFSTVGTILKDCLTVTLNEKCRIDEKTLSNCTRTICDIKCEYGKPYKILSLWSEGLEPEHPTTVLENKMINAIDNVITKHSIEITAIENDT